VFTIGVPTPDANNIKIFFDGIGTPVVFFCHIIPDFFERSYMIYQSGTCEATEYLS
jgi:hypothetical protein